MLRIKFDPHDLWIGLYIKPIMIQQTGSLVKGGTKYYICILPCFPIEFSTWRKVKMHVGDI